MRLKKVILNCFYAFCRRLPVRDNNVLLFSYYGEQYGGSPKYIGEYLMDHSDYKVIWAFTDSISHSGCRANVTVKYGRFAYYYRLATSGIIITNYRMTEEFRKRKGQRYLQTWHGSPCMKKIEKDAGDSIQESYRRMALNDSSQINWLITGSIAGETIFRQSFWYSGEICRTGIPQNDILVNNPEGIKKKVFRILNIRNDYKILLYAPTFRKDGDLSAYLSEFDDLLDSFSDRFGGEWVVLLRLHPHQMSLYNRFVYGERVVNATKYDDTQELLAAADALISDYSSVVFDYALTKRPCFIYVPDIDSYTSQDRGLYYHPRELPFIESGNMEELYVSVRSFDNDTYKTGIEAFLNRIGSVEDGKSCERILRLIKY